MPQSLSVDQELPLTNSEIDIISAFTENLYLFTTKRTENSVPAIENLVKQYEDVLPLLIKGGVRPDTTLTLISRKKSQHEDALFEILIDDAFFDVYLKVMHDIEMREQDWLDSQNSSIPQLSVNTFKACLHRFSQKTENEEIEKGNPWINQADIRREIVRELKVEIDFNKEEDA